MYKRQIPEWAEDIVMYHIFPDSFANDRRELTEKATRHMLLPDEKSDSNGKILPDRICKNHLGGTLKGICENLDYIEKLGINCIYLNPIFEAASYHKYDKMCIRDRSWTGDCPPYDGTSDK